MKRYPKNTKYKKYHKGKLFKFEYKSISLKFGILGLKALESGTLNYNQLEAARQAISRKTKRMGKIWIRVFTDRPVTKKPIGARMGKGKGGMDHWAVKVAAGAVIFEVCGPSEKAISEGLRTGGNKLPIKSKVFK